MHPVKPAFRVEDWLLERFPRQPQIYFGISGAALLGEALESEKRSVVVLSAFMCPSISLMALRAGKRVIHVDADPVTLLPNPDLLDACLAQQKPADTVLLIDHSFGFPFSGLAAIKKRYPDLLVIEDCARALGARIAGRFPGEHADWVLLSMYKTIRGSQNGGVLLTRNPVPIRDSAMAPATLRERAAMVPPLRFVYDLLKRGRPEFDLRVAGQTAPEWTPAHGLPSALCLQRFAAELLDFERRELLRRRIADDLAGSLSGFSGIECVQPAPGCQSAGQFVSFRMPGRQLRDSVLTALHKKGLFLSRTWDLLPAHYHCFAGTFPWGYEGARRLGETIAHIPVNLFLSGKRGQTLVRALGELCSARARRAA